MICFLAFLLFLLSGFSLLGIAVFWYRACRVNGRVLYSSDFDIILVVRIELFPVSKALEMRTS